MEELNFSTQMPYKVSDEQIGALCERIRNSTTREVEHNFRTIRPLRIATLATVATVIVVGGTILIHNRQQPPVQEEQRLEAVLSSTSDEVIARVAQNNYDDILFNQKL